MHFHMNYNIFGEFPYSTSAPHMLQCYIVHAYILASARFDRIHNYILFHVRSESHTKLNANISWRLARQQCYGAYASMCARECVVYLANEDVSSRSQINCAKMLCTSVDASRNNYMYLCEHLCGNESS